MIRALIVDDEMHARQELQVLLQQLGGVEILASCANAVDALRQINALRPQALFLDIQMPMIDGFQLLSMIDPERMPHVVFVTAYDEYALKAFEEKTLDYLLKPVDKERLTRAVQKLRAVLESGQIPRYALPVLHQIPCLRGQRIKLVPVDAIESVRSGLTGVHVGTVEGEFFTEMTLKTLEDQTPLLRCHKQTLINPQHIDEIQVHDNGTAEITARSGRQFGVSRRYLRQLRQALQL